jgi:hypothetical protein
VSNVDFNMLLNSILGMNGYEVGRFGESINEHPNQIKLVGSQRQTHNELNADVNPLLV